MRPADEELHTNEMSCVFDNILRIKRLSSCIQCTLYSLLGHWYFHLILLPLTTTQPKCNVAWSTSTKQLILFAMQTSKPQQHHRLYEIEVKFRELWNPCEKSKQVVKQSKDCLQLDGRRGESIQTLGLLRRDNSHTACQIQTFINTPLLNQTLVAM